jgi:peptide/nickel transport system substrate-binding protein
MQQRFVKLGAVVLASVLATGLALPVQAQKAGGVLNIATIGEPPTLDPMASTADLVGIISQHIFETLYTFGDGWKLSPLLAAELPAITDGGKTYTIKLRQGVTFHDGSAMTSADVVASLKRWGEIAVRGKQAAAQIDSIAATGNDTVVIKLKEPFAPLLALLALNNSAAVIMPAAKQPAQLTEFVGTGPYKFKERQPDRYVLLTKNDKYASRSGNADFYGGARKPYLDELRFVPVPNGRPVPVRRLAAGRSLSALQGCQVRRFPDQALRLADHVLQHQAGFAGQYRRASRGAGFAQFQRHAGSRLRLEGLL